MFASTLLPKIRDFRESELPKEVIIVIEYIVGMSAYYASSLRGCYSRGAKIGGSRRKLAAFPQLRSSRRLSLAMRALSGHSE